MPRCAVCEKWVGLDTEQDPEHNIELEDGVLTGTVSIENACIECNSALKRAEFDVDDSPDLEHDCPDKREWEKDPERNDEPEWWDVNVELSRTERHDPPKAKIYSTYYGYEGTVTLTCTCGHKIEVPLSGEMKASHMDDA